MPWTRSDESALANVKGVPVILIDTDVDNRIGVINFNTIGKL